MPKQPKNLEEIVEAIPEIWMPSFPGVRKVVRRAIRQALEVIEVKKIKIKKDATFGTAVYGYNQAIDDFNKLKKQFLGEQKKSYKWDLKKLRKLAQRVKKNDQKTNK